MHGASAFSAARADRRHAARDRKHGCATRALKRGWCASARSRASARDGFAHSAVGTSSSCTAATFRRVRASAFLPVPPFSGAASEGGAAGARLPQHLPHPRVLPRLAGPGLSSSLSELREVLHESEPDSLPLSYVRLQSSDGGFGGRNGAPAIPRRFYAHCIPGGVKQDRSGGV